MFMLNDIITTGTKKNVRQIACTLTGSNEMVCENKMVNLLMQNSHLTLVQPMFTSAMTRCNWATRQGLRFGAWLCTTGIDTCLTVHPH
jgi:hypothetical protein